MQKLTQDLLLRNQKLIVDKASIYSHDELEADELLSDF